MAHALARAIAPERDDDALTLALQIKDVPLHRLEHIRVRLGTFSREVMALAGVDLDLAARFRNRERRQCGQL
jgi:hypothetical protein